MGKLRRSCRPSPVLALVLLLAACGGGDPDAGETGAATPPAGFQTRTAGVLTVATELPNPPFVLGEDLDHLKGGYEVDMVAEIAKRLEVGQVRWVSFPFSELVAGARCPCDFAVNGVSILPDRRQRVDFSSPYFTANQGLLVRKGTAVTGVAEARKLQFGVQKDTSGALYLERTVKPAEPATVFDSTTAAVLALRARRVDAVMSDVPIVVDAASNDPGLQVIGQFKTDEQYGAVLAKGSPNTRALSQVIDQLRDDGVLDQLFQRYFPEQVDIPPLG
ncbi:MAG TPA: ABC transporter substrate-binding protein [Actinomycetes bacterium]|nr:ABC transporter substrate-binding protein [Actinomycetes bacterium]